MEFIAPAEIEGSGALPASQQHVVIHLGEALQPSRELVAECQAENPSVGRLSVEPVSRLEIYIYRTNRFGHFDRQQKPWAEIHQAALVRVARVVHFELRISGD